MESVFVERKERLGGDEEMKSFVSRSYEEEEESSVMILGALSVGVALACTRSAEGGLSAASALSYPFVRADVSAGSRSC